MDYGYDDNSRYINSADYKVVETKLKELDQVMEDLALKSIASRRLRYAEVDIEAEREEGRLQPDEMYIPQHIIDTNIRREQSAYVQYITQSPRAVILEDSLDPTVDLSLLEKDLTKKIRFDGWQLSMFSNIDNFQANGYGVMELVMDLNNPGELGTESVQFGDFAYLQDTRDLQAVEYTERAYYFTKTRLLELCGDPKNLQDDDFDYNQCKKVIDSSPEQADTTITNNQIDNEGRSLYRIKKVMFRINGVVNVAWTCPTICDDWLRKPRPLYIGRRKINPPSTMQKVGAGLSKMVGKTPQPQSENAYETQYPYFLFPYLISENDTISMLKGRVFLDQDLQEAVTSLLSTACTKERRAAGMYFSKDVSDPNDDLMLQKNIFFRSGSVINAKVQAFTLQGNDPGIFSAINALVTGNQNETSQVNFAVQNRKDSRKTAKEIQVASQQAQILSTVQVVLFSIALKSLYTTMSDVIKSRVQAGLIVVNQAVRPLYDRTFIVKPSGDTDVVEKQQMIQAMQQAWPVMQQTAAASPFMIDLISLLFPLNAAKYVQAIQQQAQQQQQQQQSSQMQMLQYGLQMLKSLAQGIIKLSKEPQMFSDIGRVHAFPIVEHYADQLEALEKQINQGGKAPPNPKPKPLGHV
jgi:hypothetical protein